MILCNCKFSVCVCVLFFTFEASLGVTQLISLESLSLIHLGSVRNVFVHPNVRCSICVTKNYLTGTTVEGWVEIGYPRTQISLVNFSILIIKMSPP